MSALVLDAQAVSVLADRQDSLALRIVRDALAAAVVNKSQVVVPAACLAELYRGGGFDQRTDSVLARTIGIGVRDTDRALARVVGHLLSAAGRGSGDHVDATVVATCLTAGGGLILTSDPQDLTLLAANAPNITIHGL